MPRRRGREGEEAGLTRVRSGGEDGGIEGLDCTRDMLVVATGDMLVVVAENAIHQLSSLLH